MKALNVSKSKKEFFSDKSSWVVNLIIRVICLVLVLIIFQACQNISLSRLEGTVCSYYKNRYGQEACVFKGRSVDLYNYRQTVGQVDLLFVVDESNSMAADQRSIGDKFAELLDSGPLSELSFQVGMTSMTLGQEGTLLDFDKHGLKILKETTPSVQALFASTVSRPDSQNCENLHTASRSCFGSPRDTERGICAARHALGHSVWRSGAHMAVVFLTDENGPKSRTKNSIRTACDEPSNLLKFISDTPSLSRRLMSFHSIVVDTQACKASRDARAKKTQEGNRLLLNTRSGGGENFPTGAVPEPSEIGRDYMMLSQSGRAGTRISQGQVISICSNSYSTGLGQLGQTLEDYQRLIALPCEYKALKLKHLTESFPDEASKLTENFGFQAFIGSTALVLGTDYTFQDRLFLKLSSDIPLNSVVNIKMHCPVTASEIASE